MSKVYTFNIRTPQTTAMIDITAQVREAVIASIQLNGIFRDYNYHRMAGCCLGLGRGFVLQNMMAPDSGEFM